MADNMVPSNVYGELVGGTSSSHKSANEYAGKILRDAQIEKYFDLYSSGSKAVGIASKSFSAINLAKNSNYAYKNIQTVDKDIILFNMIVVYVLHKTFHSQESTEIQMSILETFIDKNYEYFVGTGSNKSQFNIDLELKNADPKKRDDIIKKYASDTSYVSHGYDLITADKMAAKHQQFFRAVRI